ncbi:hypothetical protein PIB30_015510, partial [Stylosanthes scabra]|nr:hypothetical protein [Stylosanthes scabra]
LMESTLLQANKANNVTFEEVLTRIPKAILNLIDTHYRLSSLSETSLSSASAKVTMSLPFMLVLMRSNGPSPRMKPPLRSTILTVSSPSVP